MGDKALQKIDIFISSPSDVREERRIALEVIGRLNELSHIRANYVLVPLAYEGSVPAAIGETPQRTVDRYMMEAGNSDIFICILWRRMGTPVVHEATSERFESGTEYEFLDAYRANQHSRTPDSPGRPYMLLYRGMKPLPADSDFEQAHKVQQFFKRFEGQQADFKGLYRSYADDAEFERTLFHDLETVIAENIIRLAPIEGTTLAGAGPQRRDFYAHIQLPVNYVPREELLATARAALLTDRSNIALTSAIQSRPAESDSTALHGMGGIGKSVTARALCDDAAVQVAFPDGILWATLGKQIGEADLIRRLREWVTALGGTVAENVATVDLLKANLAGLLNQRACLLILDDVWQRKHAEMFRVGGPRCRLLITTRDTEIARELGANVRPVPTMTVAEAIVLLEEWAGGALADIDRDLKEQIVGRLGRLPLAVKLAGPQLGRKAPDQWLRTFDARKLKSRRAEDIHDSLEQTFGLSLEDLTPHDRGLYAALAIFKEDERVHEAGIMRLWEGLGNLDADAIAELIDDLAARALLELAGHTYPRAVLLHDLLRDFMDAELGDRRAEAHRALLETYRKTQTGAGWHTAPDDGYLYDHLAYHLMALGAAGELKALFADQAWLRARVPASGYEYDGYLADLAIAWEEFAHREALEQIAAGEEPAAMADCLRFALIRTSINSIAGNYPPELVAQAVKTGQWTTRRALSVAARMPDEGQKAKMYTALLATGKLDGPERSEACKRGLEAVLAIANEQAHAQALAALAPHLEGDLLAQALEAARAIEDEYWRAQALAALAPHLEGVLLAQGLDAARAITNGFWQAQALAALAPDLEGVSLAQRLVAARAIVDELWYAQKFASQAPAHWVEMVLAQGLDAARAIAALASQLGGEQQGDALTQALEAARAIVGEYSRARALTVLASQLGGEQQGDALTQALEAARAIEDEYWRAQALAALAPQMDGALLVEALEAARAIGDEGNRAMVLAALARQLEGEQQTEALAQALEAARAIEDEYWRAMVLAALAPQLEGEQQTEALDAARAIGDEGSRAMALTALALQLVGKQQGDALTQALEAARAIGDEGSRAMALTALARQLEGEQQTDALTQALEAARAIGDEYWRAQALAALARQLGGASGIAGAFALVSRKTRLIAALPQEVRRAIVDEHSRTSALGPQALEAARAIVDEQARADALAVLAPHLEGDLLAQALNTAHLIASASARAEVLAAFLPVAPHTAALVRDIQRAIAAYLLAAKDKRRDGVLLFCAREQLFAPPVLSPATLGAIAAHIAEICEEWQWL